MTSLIEVYLRDQVQAMREAVLAESDQLNLGQLIEQLEKVEDPDESDVYFDFGYTVPTTWASWRGIYAELAIGWSEPNAKVKAPTVSAFLAACRACVGQAFEGWKGGDFVMGLHTPVWVANPGDANNTAIVGVQDLGYRAILRTAYRET